MRVIVNGTDAELPAGATVADAAETRGVTPADRGVAVAVDGEVVPKAEWGTTALADGAAVEVVRAAAGG